MGFDGHLVETLFIWSLMGFDGHLVEKLGTAPKQNLTEAHFLRYQPQIWSTTSSDFCFSFSSSFTVKHVL